MNRTSFDFKKMKESIFKKMKRKSRKGLATMPGVYDELPPPRSTDDTYLRPTANGTQNGGNQDVGEPFLDNAMAPDPEVASSGIPTLPPPPPKPLSESEVEVPVAKTSVSFAGVILKDPSRGRTSARFDKAEPASSKEPRNSHIVHENEFGDKVEYAISKKDASPERHKLIPRKVKATHAAVDEDDIYLEPSRQHISSDFLSSDSKEIARYARHIDVVPNVDPYYTDTSSVGGAAELIKKFEASSPPRTNYRTPHSPPTKIPVNKESVLINKARENTNTAPVGNEHKMGQSGVAIDNVKQGHVSTENIAPNPVFAPTQHDKTGSGVLALYSQPPPTSPSPQQRDNTMVEPSVFPPAVNSPISHSPVTPNPVSPGSPGATQWQHKNEWGNTSPLPDTRNAHEPFKKHQSQHQENIDHSLDSKNTLPTAKSYEYFPDSRSQTSEEAETPAGPQTFAVPRNSAAPQIFAAPQSFAAPMISAAIQTSNENLRPEYLNSDVNDTKSTRKPVPVITKSVSYEEHPGGIPNSYYATSTQTVYDDSFDIPENSGFTETIVMSDGKAQMKSVGTFVESDDFNPTTHTKMKTRGTSAGREPDLRDYVPSRHNNSRQIQYEDDIDFDDKVSRVHYVPKADQRSHQRIRIETYCERYTQTEESMFDLVEPRMSAQSRSKTYSHGVRMRSQLPESWQRRQVGNYDEDSDISKRVSKEWYKREDAPELWDPDRMLNMFAEELNRKAVIGPHQGVIELREEFDPKKFLEHVPKQDSSGAPFPPWKRLVMAKQMAEKAQLEADQRNKKTEEEIRLENMPLWKRAIVQKRAAYP